MACLAGDLLIVTAGIGSTSATATWNGISMSLALSQISSSPNTGYIFYLVVASGATGTVIVSWSGSHQAVISVSTVQGITTSSPLDQVVSATGSGTSPSSGATSATSLAAEIAFGLIEVPSISGPISGSWSNGWTANQAANLAGTVNAISDGYLVLSSTGAQTAAKTGTNTGTWAAICATFKGLPAGLAGEPVVSMQAVNRSAVY